MSLVNDDMFKNYLLNYEEKAVNQYTKNGTSGFLKKAASNLNSVVESNKISKSIIKSAINYNGQEIGYLNGVRPSSTSNEGVRFSKNPTMVKEYLTLQNIEFDENGSGDFNIRINVIEGQFSSASLILPPFVIGTGKHSIAELVKQKNEKRKSISFFNTGLITLDEEAESELEKSNLTRETILKKNNVYIIKKVYNIKSGSETINISNEISKNIIKKALDTIASIPGMYSAAIDIEVDNIENPSVIKFGDVLASPSPLRHYLPYKGHADSLYEQYIGTLIAEYKRENKIELSDNEQSIIDNVDIFKQTKKEYMDKIINKKWDIEHVSKELHGHLNIIESEELVEQSKILSILAKENVVINEEIFKLDSNSSKIMITESNVLRLIKPRKDSVLMVSKALNNEIVPFPGFESVKFDDNYYYTDKTKSYGASYQLYVQSLRIAAVLLLDYEKSKNISCFYKAEEIIYKWITFVSNGTEERMVWYDHPTANRTQVLIHYLYLAQNANIKVDYKLFRSILKKHAEVLANDEIYNNNNHGLMMDKSLMILGNVLSEEKFFIKGYYRSIDTFWYSFSSQGTHLENSPEYHSMVVRMYVELQKYLLANNQTYNKNILNYLDIAKKYLNIIIKPDSKLPPVGDSGNVVRKIKKTYENFYDYEAGIAILQYKNDKSFYVNFICGYSSKTHKHKDDLSINLNYNGEDFFIDAGKFNYNSKSPIRKYVISKNAHSSFQLRDHNYQLNNTNRYDRNIKMTGFNFTDNVSYVKGSHAGYVTSQAVLNRMVVQIKNLPIVILYDYINNPKEIKYNFVQNFNLSENVKVKKKRKFFELSGKSEKLVVKQLLKVDKQNVVEGDESIPIAVNTTGFSKVTEASQLKYYKNTSNKNVYVTAIFDNTVIKDVELLKIDSTIELKIDGKNYTLNI